MPRPTVQVDREKLTQAIRQAESKGPLANQSMVFESACEIYNTRNPGLAKIKAGTAYNRADEWGIKLVTPKGKRGAMTAEHKAAMKAGRGNRESRATLFQLPIYKPTFEAMRRMNPEALGLIDDIEKKGSMRAAVDLNCRHCMGHDNVVSSIRECPSKGCAFYVFRPYKTEAEEAASPEPEQA
jgi:hypothetical protein